MKKIKESFTIVLIAQLKNQEKWLGQVSFVATDLPSRIEERYIIFSRDQSIEDSLPNMKRIKFSDNEHVQTIYLNNDEFELPFDVSIKCRRYIPKFTKMPITDKNKYLLEIKKSVGESKKDKIRYNTPLEEAISIVEKKFKPKHPLRPFLAVQNHRHHYVPKDGTGLRITLDYDTTYFFLLEINGEWKKLAKEDDIIRIEIKYESSNLENLTLLKNFFTDYKSFPIISKRSYGFNLISDYKQKNEPKINKNLEKMEIEAKLNNGTEKIFHSAKAFFKKGIIGYSIAPDHSFTLEKTRINRYYKKGNKIFQANFKGRKMNLKRKGETEILQNSKGFCCILKRPEEKDRNVSIKSKILPEAELLGELKRKRKIFWIYNKETKRVYQISLDRCSSNKGLLNQIEIEYEGALDDQIADENIIAEDIAELSSILLKKYPKLDASALTKEEWLIP